MKKIFLILMLLLPLNVAAKELCLDNLIVKNGELSLEFDKYNLKYTVSIGKDVESLELEYLADKDVNVTINDNHDLKNNDIVTINLQKEDDTVSYELAILKEETEETMVFQEAINNQENNFMMQYKIFIIPPVCLILIVLSWRLLFRKHKK